VVRRITTSDDAGIFLITNLPPGTYTVTVQADGFGQKQFSDVVLEVGQNLALATALSVGGVTASQTVQATAELINKSIFRRRRFYRSPGYR